MIYIREKTANYSPNTTGVPLGNNRCHAKETIYSNILVNLLLYDRKKLTTIFFDHSFFKEIELADTLIVDLCSATVCSTMELERDVGTSNDNDFI